MLGVTLVPNMQMLLLALCCLWCSFTVADDSVTTPARHFTVPMAEILQQQIYVSANAEGELQVRWASQGSDLRNGDYLALADHMRILNGGLETFISSEEKEVIVPVVDDADIQHGGVRFLGFVQLTNFIPRKVTARRGEVETLWDLEEGGPPPKFQLGNVVISGSGALLSDDKNYTPPPSGGGGCITGRDCYWHNGTCVGGQCACDSSATGMTGSYCQLYRPDKNKVGEMMAYRAKRRRELEQQKLPKIQSGPRALQMHASRNLQQAAAGAAAAAAAAAGLDAQKHSAAQVKRPSPPPPPPPPPPTARSDSDSSSAAAKPAQTQTPLDDDADAEDDADAPRLESKPVKRKIVKTKMKPKPKPNPQQATAGAGTGAAEIGAKSSEGKNPASAATAGAAPLLSPVPPSPLSAPNPLFADEEPIDETDARQRFLRDKRRRAQEANAAKEVELAAKAAEEANIAAHEKKLEAERAAFERELAARSTTEQAKRRPSDIGLPSANPNQVEATVEELYGNGKAYPEPYMAGKVPPEFVHVRHKARAEKKEFIYSVRYRSGPLGITFDNTLATGTVVEKVGKGMQSDLSDIQPGDIVIAIDQYNTTQATAKIAQRIMSALSWPRIVTFKVKGARISKEDIEKEKIRRSVDLNLVYPPMLTQEFQAKLADWSAQFDDQDYIRDFLASKNNHGNLGLQYRADACEVYMLRAASDQFGCSIRENEYALPDVALMILKRRGDLDKVLVKPDGSNDRLSPADKLEIENTFPMLLMLAREAETRGVPFTIQPTALTKRGICTFVQKGTNMAKNGAVLGLVVNTKEGDAEGNDMPCGKEITSDCKVPIAMSNFSDTDLVLTHAADRPLGDMLFKKFPEIFALRGGVRMNPACVKIQTIFEDVVDAWPHSEPHIPLDNVMFPLGVADKGAEGNSLQSREPFKVRKTADEGGRIAVSGENGWAFFDYHLANFGPGTEDLPLTTMRLVMAMPAFGCDPNAYSIRITGAVVAILRGGGCSFGIKVINAQKLGALAVLIVNTDDAKTMRLMALPDEIPQISIPCLMVSRRLQFFMESKLKRYYGLNQHLMSIQPTGVFGMYEERNTVTLPTRFDVPVPQKGKK